MPSQFSHIFSVSQQLLKVKANLKIIPHIIFGFFLFIPHPQIYCENLNEVLSRVESDIQKGNQTSSFEERKLAYNDAIILLNSVKEKDASPRIDQVLGNIYFDLGEYPLALFSYYCVIKKGLDSDEIERKIDEINQILGIDSMNTQKDFSFFEYFSLSPYSRLQTIVYLFISIFLLTFILFSIHIWVPNFISKKFIFASIILCVYLTSVLLARIYFAPVEAIVIRSTRMYSKVNDLEQTQLKTTPLIAGNKITIIKLSQDKKWVKIKSSHGLIGYIPISNIQTLCNE